MMTVETAVFKANQDFIESFNIGNNNFWLGVNQFVDITNAKLSATKTNPMSILQNSRTRT
jgi:hypothetical protein